MKRTSKILVLVLSLALVIGAVAMVASAAASDLTVKATANFESQKVGLLCTATDGKSPNGGSIIFHQGGRTGRVDIVEGTDGNKYALVTQTDKVGTSGPYAYMSTGGNASIGEDGVIVPGSNDFSNYKYLSYEVDIMSPTGKLPTGGSIDPSARAYKSGATARDFWNTNAHSSIVVFGNDDNGTYLYSAADTSAKMYINPYEFTHIQVILENTTKEGDTNIGLTSHVYVNGELWFSKVATNVSTNYHSGIPHAAFIEFKINYTTANDPTQTLAIDNVKYSTVAAGSESAVEDILTYDAAKMPAGTVVAEVNGVKYENLAKAIAQAPAGGTVKLLTNVTNTVTASKVVNIEAGEFTANLKAATGYTVAKEGTTYKVTGITVKKSEDAQDMADNWGKVGSFDTTKLGYGASNNVFGTTTLGKDSTGNKYMIFAPVGGTEGNDIYLGTGYGGTGSTINGTRPSGKDGVLNYAGSVEFFPYLVQDIDVAAPSGQFAAFGIALQGRYIDANGAIQSWNGSSGINVASDSTGSYVSSGSNKVYVNPYEFTHITYIVEGVTTDTYCYANFYVYVNGEYLNSVLVSPTQAGKSYYNNIPHWTIDEIRFGLGGDKKFHDDCDIAIDNMVTRIFTPDYAEVGGLAEILKAKSSLSAWEYDLNDDSKKAMIAVASIGDVEYNDLQAAFDAVKDGETIKILKNIATPVVINNAFNNVTVDAGENTVNLVAGVGMELTNDGNVYTATEIAPKLFQYTKGGQTVYGIGTLAAAVADADAGSTLKLLADIDVGAVRIDIGKKLTIDLNGYTIKALTEGSKAKTSLFRMTSGTDLTLTSSRKGGKIFNEGWNGATSVGAAGLIYLSNDVAKFHVKGNGPDGTPYLSIFTGNFIQGYSNALEYDIDGGMFITVRQDQQGIIDLRKAGHDASVKNAIFFAGTNVFGYGGRNLALDNECNIVMDNCVVIGNLVNDFVDPVVLTVTNTYITGTVKPGVFTYKQASHAANGNEIPTADRVANTVGNVILGEGVYVGGEISADVEIAEGYTLYNEEIAKELTYDSHAWKASADFTFDESSFVVTPVTKMYTFKHFVDKAAIKAIWKDADGNVIGENLVVPGKTANAPSDLAPVAVVDKWISGVPTEWNESLLVPADATEITFTAKKGGAMYLYADVEMLFNIKVQSHNQINFYVPFETNGIEIVSAYIDATLRYGQKADGSLQNWSTVTNYMANGKYHGMSVWPGVMNAAKTVWTGKVTFTYEGTEYTFSAQCSMAKYVDTVVNGNLGYSEQAKALVINSANYIVEAFDYYYTNPAENETAVTKQLRAIVEANKDKIIAPAAEELVVPNTEAIAKYIKGVSMIIDAQTPGYRFYLTDAAKAEGVTVTLEGWNAKTGSDDNGSYIQTTGGVVMSAFNNVTVTVKTADETVTLKYSVANYIKALENDKCVDLLYAIYGYIKADKIY